MNIHEFARQLLNRIPVSEANVDWYSMFEAEGYYHVLPAPGGWREMLNWLKDNIGEKHFVWHGNHFWFETQEDATLFALLWA